MCGILGFASHQLIQQRNELTRGISSLNHRGPDDTDDVKVLKVGYMVACGRK